MSSKINQGSSTAKDNAFPTWSTCAKASRDDFTMYDSAIRRPQPVFVAAWLKAASNETSVASGGWHDSRVFCIPIKEAEPGSRTLADADKEAGVTAPSATSTKPSGAAGRSEGIATIWLASVAIVVALTSAV